MKFGTEARIALVALVGLCVPTAGALAQSDPDSANGLDAPASEAIPGASQEEDAQGFWDWADNIEIEYPDAQSTDFQRPYSGGREGGGGGDSGGGGGHGG